jgi:hypothetical protein
VSISATASGPVAAAAAAAAVLRGSGAAAVVVLRGSGAASVVLLSLQERLLVNTDGREYTEVQAEGGDKVPASEKKKKRR